MTTPTKLSGATTTIKVGDTDLHTMGMIVNDVRNPCPAARDASFQIAQRDGDFDFTTHYGPRTMTLSGNIIGNSNDDLQDRIDSLKSFFRLRKSRGTFQVIFQNETDRYWTCRFQSFDVGAVGKWFMGHTAAFTLVLKCVKPYAEATAITTVDAFLHCLKNKVITYPGTVDAPMALKITQRFYENLLEKQAGACNEDNTLWTLTNATGSNGSSSQAIFGDACPHISRTSSGEFYADIDVTAQINSAKNYVFGAFIYVGQATTNYIEAIIAGASNVSEAFVLPGDTNNWYFAFVKVDSTDLSGMSSVKFRIRNTGSASEFYIDGAFIYEISNQESTDAEYFPPPYMSDPTGDDYVPPKNPKLVVHKNINLFKWKNGDTSDWITIANSIVPDTVRDPFDPGGKCLLISTKANGDSCGSGIIYAAPGEIYQLIFDYYIEKASGTLDIGFLGFASETNFSYYRELAKIAAPAAGSAWVHNYTSETFRFVMPNECGVLRFVVLQSGAGALKLYLKNIQISKAALITDPAAAYVEPDVVQLAHTGTIAADDDLLIDNDAFVSEYYTDATKVVSNGMANLSGNPLFLSPGSNTIRYSDARMSSNGPEAESCGSVNCAISYRARYL